MYEFDSSKTDSEGHSGSEYRYSGPFYQDSYRTGSSGRTAGDVPPKKKKSFLRLLGRAACVGLVFGIIASAAFQATNYAGRQMFGEDMTALNLSLIHI